MQWAIALAAVEATQVSTSEEKSELEGELVCRLLEVQHVVVVGLDLLHAALSRAEAAQTLA